MAKRKVRIVYLMGAVAMGCCQNSQIVSATSDYCRCKNCGRWRFEGCLCWHEVHEERCDCYDSEEDRRGDLHDIRF